MSRYEGSPVEIARALAADHPGGPTAKLPCPVCAASVGAGQLVAHLAKQHGDPPREAPWTGRGGIGKWFHADLELADAGALLVMRHTLGLARRAVALPCTVEVGALVADRPDAVTSSIDAGGAVQTTTIRAGVYVRLADATGRALVLACTSDTGTKAHWRGWTQGAPRKAYDVRVARPTLAAIEYALVARGALTVP